MDFELISLLTMTKVLTLYFFALPFQLVKSLGMNVVLVTIVTAFALFGADAIGDFTFPCVLCRQDAFNIRIHYD